MNDAVWGPLLTFLLIVLYGGLHSLLASNWAKAQAERLLGTFSQRGYRILYNMLGMALLLPLLGFVAAFPGRILYEISGVWRYLAIGGQIGAVVFLIVDLMSTNIRHFLGISQMMGNGNVEVPELVVTGPYRYVQHQLYAAGLLFIWLMPVMTTSTLALVISLTIYTYIGSIFEERRLLKEFGTAYADYQRMVPRLVPIRWRNISRDDDQR